MKHAVILLKMKLKLYGIHNQMCGQEDARHTTAGSAVGWLTEEQFAFAILSTNIRQTNFY